MQELKGRERLLLSHFRRNARESLTTISRETRVPVSTIFDKLKHYERQFIRKHTTLVDFSKLGYMTRANVMLKVAVEGLDPGDTPAATGKDGKDSKPFGSYSKEPGDGKDAKDSKDKKK